MKIKVINRKKEVLVKDIEVGQFFKLTSNSYVYLRISASDHTFANTLPVVCFGLANDKHIYPQISKLSGSLCVEEVYNSIEFTD